MLPFVKTPRLAQALFPNALWRIPADGQRIYLTFDDGPNPTVTPIILDILKYYNVKASFFCLGVNVQKYPGIYNRIIEEGHVTGNHGFEHMDGWKTSTKQYVQMVRQCDDLIQSKYFRPPYGRLKYAQYTKLNKHYQIVMWSILSKDYDQQVSDQQVIANVVNNAASGLIYVFHDNDKTQTRIESILTKVIPQLQNSGFELTRLP